ncbi:MAG: riboflavin synthase [Chloroflexota bacterium]|nr:riboflavin synthase [Chloroflexota bacterium]
MFTGIVEEVGTVRAAGQGRLTIAAREVMPTLEIGGSISVNGTCLTVTRLESGEFAVDVVPETLRRTNLGLLSSNSPVNLERPLRADGRLDGHIVQGHVDGTGTIGEISEDGEALMVRIDVPAQLVRYVVEKGFIAVDGVSLTVVHCDEAGFSVTVIPHTRDHTVFGSRSVGDAVNIEIDILAKYVERLTAGR